MSDKDFQNFVDNQIKRINEYAKWEEFFNDTLSKKVIRKNKQFNIVDKEWIEKWKEYVGFEEIKEKCKKFSEKENQTMKQEISEFLLKKNAKQKLEELGPLDCSKIKRQNNKFIFFEETSNFLPIESFNFNYFKPKDVIAVNGDFIKGKCFLNNINFAKNENKKIVIIEKNNHNNEIKEAIITLEAKEDIKKVKEELSEKSLEEILNDERFKNKIIEKEIVKKNKSENKEQEIEKPKNEKLANEKPENRGTDNKGQENEIPNKEPENEKSKNKGPKNKEPENEKSKSEKPQNKEIENQKPENEKQDKYSSENKETKNTKPENEKQENKTSENKETKNEKQENEKQENKTSENKEPKIEKQENTTSENKEPKNEKQENTTSENKEPKNEKQGNKKQENNGNLENKEQKNEKQEDKKSENNSQENKEAKNEKQEDKKPENNSQENKEAKNGKPENKTPENKQIKNEKLENKKQENKEPENKETKIAKQENKKTENNSPENKETKNTKPENKKQENKETKNTKQENEKQENETSESKEQKNGKQENKKPENNGNLENKKQVNKTLENKEQKNEKQENEKQENKASENKEPKIEKQENKKQENKTSENKEPKIEKQENKNPEKQKQINKEEENKLKKEKENKIIEGMAEIYNYNYKIKEQFSQKDKSFLLKCSVINKEWYKKFLENSNFEFFKGKFEKLKFKNVEEIQNNIRNDINKINFNNLQSLQKDADITSKPLDNIENLAFVSEEFLIKINEFMKGNNNNDNKEKLQNKNVISNNNKQIMIKNGQALLKMNDQKFICFNPQEGNINEVKNQQIVEFPKDKKIDLFKLIENDNKNAGIKNIVNKQIYEVHSKPIDKKINASFNDKIKIKKTIEGQSSLGLDNVGATCYMNATLQCLAHIKKVSEQVINYRENGKFKEDKKKYQLSSVYADVLKGIWFPDNKKAISFAPNEFKNVLGKMNPLFAPTAANDAKDLLIYLIEQMHNELNNSKEENLALIMPDNMDPTNQNQVLTCFVEEFMKKYNSVFSHYFYGSNMSMTRCFGCNITKYSYQCFSFLIFPLLEAKKYCVIAGRIPPFFYNQYILNIEDCFIYNQKIEFFTGDNQMYCNQCRQLMNSSMGTCIYTAPLVLILVLNRGKGNLDFREKFEFWEIIDLTNYVLFKQADNRYFLAGVITHLGESGDSGHFIAFCRMSEISPWFCYNDSMVTQTDFRDINTRGTPYILFYQKIKL